jgi:hypothetical protein
MKKTVPTSAKPIPSTRIGTSIIIENAPGRSSGITAETCHAVNARSRQAIMIILRVFARFMNFFEINYFVKD